MVETALRVGREETSARLFHADLLVLVSVSGSIGAGKRDPDTDSGDQFLEAAQGAREVFKRDSVNVDGKELPG